MAAREAEASWQREAEELRTRLEAAERVCVLYGWTSLGDDSDRSKALYQIWSEWVSLVGSDFTGPAAHPELSEERITELARERDEGRRRTLERIRETGS